ncbi:hypothetical protein AQ490_06515 [Wenjunlia vitaminophila]|uniref:Uncharacterized protein n=1 Tax=Wenjunlia vitaminophila TaxID=76728 RepID=A0A0T6LNP3_WENVI|nr:hypothetical protein [Wenjunlia vitaminophila]KRV47545.1 hypothetical protein AQ490_06515 [Wenjunlia vitaminophila]
MDHVSRPLTTDQAEAEERRLIAEALALEPVATSYRDPSPIPAVGTAPPVAQPGRPPMSQRAADASGVMLAGGIATLPVGAAATAVLWASGQADPAVIACICAAPTALVIALSRLVTRAKAAAPEAPVHHHHYEGADIRVQSTEVTTHTTGLLARTRTDITRKAR